MVYWKVVLMAVLKAFVLVAYSVDLKENKKVAKLVAEMAVLMDVLMDDVWVDN